MNRPQEHFLNTPRSFFHLTRLQTPFGERSLYDSVASCNRCGSCMQVCPVYRLRRTEPDSPRGRNQAIRLALEGKLKITEPVLQRSMEACTLCGRCSQMCAAQLPTAEHVLATRRALAKRRLPLLLQKILSLRGQKPILFERTVQLGLRLRPIWKTVSVVPGMGWLKLAAKRIVKKRISLKTALKKEQIYTQEENPELIYLPSLEAEFLQPEIAVSSLRLLTAKGKTACWFNTACGLFEYVYGDLRQSKQLLRRLMYKHLHTEKGMLPLVTDSLDVYHFLKQAAQLFAPHKRLQQQADRFARQVYFITDFFPEKGLTAAQIQLPVQLNTGTLFYRESTPVNQSISLCETLFEQNFVKCEYTGFDIPAFGYAFSTGNQNEPLMLEVVKQVAQKQAKTVFTFSGLCALELNDAFHRFYPEAKAQHIVSITDKR